MNSKARTVLEFVTDIHNDSIIYRTVQFTSYKTYIGLTSRNIIPLNNRSRSKKYLMQLATLLFIIRKNKNARMCDVDTKSHFRLSI
jgi:hypothetical protein